MKPSWHFTIAFSQNKNTTPFTSNLNHYITHLTRAGPWGLQGCMGDPLDWGMSWWELAIAAYNSIYHNYYKRVKANHLTNPLQQFTHKLLHSKLYTNFTHYLHFPHPIYLVATCHHHFLVHAKGNCHPHAKGDCCPCAKGGCCPHAKGGCSSSSWLKKQNTRNVYIYMLTSTNVTHNSSDSSCIALLTYWFQSVLGIYRQKKRNQSLEYTKKIHAIGTNSNKTQTKAKFQY